MAARLRRDGWPLSHIASQCAVGSPAQAQAQAGDHRRAGLVPPMQLDLHPTHGGMNPALRLPCKMGFHPMRPAACHPALAPPPDSPAP